MLIKSKEPIPSINSADSNSPIELLILIMSLFFVLSSSLLFWIHEPRSYSPLYDVDRVFTLRSTLTWHILLFDCLVVLLNSSLLTQFLLLLTWCLFNVYFNLLSKSVASQLLSPYVLSFYYNNYDNKCFCHHKCHQNNYHYYDYCYNWCCRCSLPIGTCYSCNGRSLWQLYSLDIRFCCLSPRNICYFSCNEYSFYQHSSQLDILIEITVMLLHLIFQFELLIIPLNIVIGIAF